MSALSRAPFMDRIVNLRCRLTYAQQRVRELAIPASVTEIPPIDHRC